MEPSGAASPMPTTASATAWKRTSWVATTTSRPGTRRRSISAMHVVDLLGVQMGGRLVREEQRGIAHQGTGEGDALLLSAGQQAGTLPRMRCHPHLVQQLQGDAPR